MSYKEFQEAARATTRSKDDYWLKELCCVNNAYYNVYKLGNQKTLKVRLGGVWKNDKQLFGGDMNVATKNFHEGKSHCWVETKNGEFIIDWVLNDELQIETKVHKRSDIEKLGFRYEYYANEKAIEKKVRKWFGESGEVDRKLFGDWKKK